MICQFAISWSYTPLRAVSIAAAVVVGIAAPSVIAGTSVPALFTAAAGVQTKSAQCIRVTVICAPINGAIFALDGILAASADYNYIAKESAAASRVACVAIALAKSTANVTGLWAALNVLLIARLFAMAARLFSNNGPLAVKKCSNTSHGHGEESFMQDAEVTNEAESDSQKQGV